MRCRSVAGLAALVAMAMVLLTAPRGVAAEPEPGKANPSPVPKIDVLGGADVVPPPSLEDPATNKESALGGNPEPNKAQGDANNGLHPVFRSDVPETSPAPSSRPQPQVQPRFTPPASPVAPPPANRAAPRPQSRGNGVWRGPRYANAYGTWRPQRVTPSYGSGTGRSGPDGQRFKIVQPGYGPSSPGYASGPGPSNASSATSSLPSGVPDGRSKFGYDDNRSKDGPPALPAKGVLMQLGIDPGTYKSGDVPAGLLDRIRSDS